MKRLGIKTRVVLLGVLPAILFSFVLVVYFIATLDDTLYRHDHLAAAHYDASNGQAGVQRNEQSENISAPHSHVHADTNAVWHHPALQMLKGDLLNQLLLASLLGLLLSVLVAWLVGRYITKPIEDIAIAVKKVGDGDFSHVIAEDSSAELKVLQTGFNEMSKRIARAYEEMQESIDVATAQLRHQAQHDDLTGLVNRREFETRLATCLQGVDVPDSQHVCCYLDLDQFKLVNDACGHFAGDALLKEISGLFEENVGEGDTFARLGGDEFGLLLKNTNLTDANVVVKRLLKLARSYRFVHEERTFNVGVSIGMVAIDGLFKTTSDVMHAADIACYSAKNKGRNQSFLYNHGDSAVLQRYQDMHAISGITDKINDDSFRLYCQPIVQLGVQAQDRQRYEVLIRQVGDAGEVSLPQGFIPSAERYNLMPNVDRWVIKNTFSACRQLLNASHGKIDYQFSINLSGTSLSDSFLLHYIQEQFALYAIPPKAICFEITETAAITNFEQTRVLLKTLKQLGCQFALDDFGSGMSSFMYLKKFDVDYLKIDGAFVKEMHTNTVDYATVQSVHALAEALQIKTVAEYVERDDVLSLLKIIGVHYGQGNLLGEPIALKRLIES